MKKLTFLLMTIMVLSVTASAQKVDGSWLVTKIEVGDKVHEPLFVIEYNTDGLIITQGVNVGSWTHNQKQEKLIMESSMDKDFGGDCKIINLNQKNLNFEKNGEKWFLSRLNMAKIAEDNLKSGLIGSWEFVDDADSDATRVLTFEASDSFTLIEKQRGMVSENGGMWIFNEQDKSLLILSRRMQITGKNKILKISENELILENSGEKIAIRKFEDNSQKIERLSFTEAEFFDENGDYKYDEEEVKLPWPDSFEMLMSLINTSQLEYNFSTLIEGTEIFETEKLTADVKADKEEQVLSIDFIFYGYDKYNLPADTQLPSNTLGISETNQLFPLKENIFRVVGKEDLETVLGTYNCTVLESVGSREERYKLWMINDKPGIYAKIIEDKEGMFGHYKVYELNAITTKN